MAVKKIWLSFIALLLALSVCFVFVSSITVYNVATVLNTNKKIYIIDAGHGGLTNTIN